MSGTRQAPQAPPPKAPSDRFSEAPNIHIGNQRVWDPTNPADHSKLDEALKGLNQPAAPPVPGRS